MATLEQIHSKEIDLFSHLDTICKSNNVSYSMIGGTMLGAIRHKGFIPWDDDIDIFMHLDAFNKIKHSIATEKVFLQAPETDLQMPFAMYKLRLNDSYMQEPDMESLEMHQGIWIDIFVYVDAAKTNFAKAIQTKLFILLKSYRCRYLNRNASPSRRVHRLLTKLPRKMQLLIDSVIVLLLKAFGSKKSDEYFALDVGKHCFYPKRFFDELVRYPFEDKCFLGPKDYDGFLTMVFGKDYMIPKKWGHLPDYSNVIIK